MRPVFGMGAEAPRRTVEVSDGQNLAFVEAGSGPDIVLIHGTLVTLDDMVLGPMDRLAERFHTVAVDRPGHGHSGRPRLDDASPWRQAAVIHEGVRRMGLRRPTILGHSSGGAVALAYGLSFPDETAGVVALAPICFPEARIEQALFGPRAVPVAGDVLAAWLHGLCDPLLLPLLWSAMFLPQAMPPRFRSAFPFGLAGRTAQIVAEGEDAAALWTGLARSARAYAGCRVPVRILAGGADAVVNPFLHGAVAAGMIPGARFTLLPGMGHMIHHFRLDEVVAAALDVVAAPA